jgi:hypothetical protein
LCAKYCWICVKKLCTKYCKILKKHSPGVQERINPFYINSYRENSFCLRTFCFMNNLQERNKFVNRGLTVHWINSCRQMTRGGPPAWGLDVGLTTHHKK